ncbi:MAG: c-type cytochrome [Sulfuritalea sp.]|nr:c-type cytochrome [Sulfuritalea sp.]
MKRRLAQLTIAFAAVVAGPAALADSGPLFSYDPPLTPELRTLLHKASVEAGAQVFERKCATCHDGAKDGKPSKGPNLWNVFGRKAAFSPSFKYSAAMHKSGHTWTYSTLDYYLSDTERAVPGKAMDLAGLRSAKMRADLLAYLRTLNDTPPALP